MLAQAFPNQGKQSQLLRGQGLQLMLAGYRCFLRQSYFLQPVFQHLQQVRYCLSLRALLQVGDVLRSTQVPPCQLSLLQVALRLCPQPPRLDSFLAQQVVLACSSATRRVLAAEAYLKHSAQSNSPKAAQNLATIIVGQVSPISAQ